MEKTMNLRGRVREIKIVTLAGDEINEAKTAARVLAKAFDTKVYLQHNADSFICDAEGNVAKTNTPFDKLENHT